MQTDILQNIICSADPAVIAKNWEARERIGYYPEGFRLEPPLLERELERLEREISDFQEKFSHPQPTQMDSEWVAIAGVNHYQDVPHTRASFFKKGDFEILLEKAVAAEVPNRFEENASPEYYDKIIWDWAKNGDSGHCISSSPEETSCVNIYPSNIERHDKDLFVSDILWNMAYDDRYIHTLPEWKTDPEIEAAKKSHKGYAYRQLSEEEEDTLRLQQYKDVARDAFVQITELRRLYLEIRGNHAPG